MINLFYTTMFPGSMGEAYALSPFDFLCQLYTDMIKKSNLENCDCICIGIPMGRAVGQNKIDISLAEKICKSNKPVILFDAVEIPILCPNIHGISTRIKFQPDFPDDNHKYYMDLVLNRRFDGNLKAIFKANINNSGPYITERLPNVKYFPFEIQREFYFQNLNYITRDYPICSKQDFSNRPIDIFFYGSFSPNRYTIIDTLKHYFGDKFIETYEDRYKITKNNFLFCGPGKTYIDINDAIDLANQSKICISVEGTGCKCYRSHEVSRVSVMAKDSCDVEWSYPWTDGYNCIAFDYSDTEYTDLGHPIVIKDNIIPKIQKYLNNDDILYDIYVNGVKNSYNYRVPIYLKKYILPNIQHVINKEI